jgi:uncharacterized membrane protein (DUF2068 family)
LTLVEKPRPLGVTALAVLTAVGGGASILLGASFLSAAADLIKMLIQYDPTYATTGADVLTLSIQILAGFFIVVGVVALLDSFGLWRGMGWAWWMSVILAALGILSSVLIVPIGLVSLAIELIILYYLMRPSVRNYFKAEAAELRMSTA